MNNLQGLSPELPVVTDTSTATASLAVAPADTPAPTPAKARPPKAAKATRASAAAGASTNSSPATAAQTKPKTTPKAQAKAPKAAVKGTVKTEPKASKADAKPAKVAKPKLVRDSFTFPEGEYQTLVALKKRLLASGTEAKKGELMRAGLALLSQLDDTALASAIGRIEKLKTGRPAK